MKFKNAKELKQIATIKNNSFAKTLYKMIYKDLLKSANIGGYCCRFSNMEIYHLAIYKPHFVIKVNENFAIFNEFMKEMGYNVEVFIGDCIIVQICWD